MRHLDEAVMIMKNSKTLARTRKAMPQKANVL